MHRSAMLNSAKYEIEGIGEVRMIREWSFFNNRGGRWIFARAGRQFFGPLTGGVDIFLVPPSGKLKLSAADPFEL